MRPTSTDTECDALASRRASGNVAPNSSVGSNIVALDFRTLLVNKDIHDLSGGISTSMRGAAVASARSEYEHETAIASCTPASAYAGWRRCGTIRAAMKLPAASPRRYTANMLVNACVVVPT